MGTRRFRINGVVNQGKHAMISAMTGEAEKEKFIEEIEEALETVLARDDEELPTMGRVLHTIETVDERPVWVPHGDICMRRCGLFGTR